MTHKLSVITINLNNASGLRKTIESVVNQTYTNYEYIIIDGGSVDGSVDIIKEFTDKIAYWVSEPDTGIYNAMNKGLRRSRGELVTFINSGDTYYSYDSLKTALTFTQGKILNAQLFFFDFIYQYGENKKQVSSIDVTDKYIIYNKGFGHPSAFYKKSLFDFYGFFDETYTISADRDFYMNIIVKKRLAFAYFSFPVSVFQDGGLSTDIQYQKSIQLEDERIINKFYSDFEKRIINNLLFRKLLSTKGIGVFLVSLFGWKLNRV